MHNALPECISDKIYTTIVATIRTTLALVIGIFIMGILLIRRQWSAPVLTDFAERQKGYSVTAYISVGCMLIIFVVFLFLFWQSIIFMHFFIARVCRTAKNLYLPTGLHQQQIINKDLTIYTVKPIGGGAFGIIFPWKSVCSKSSQASYHTTAVVTTSLTDGTNRSFAEAPK